MNAIRIGKMILVAATFAASLASGASVAADQATLKAFYFGNSFLENSVPWFHPTLARSAGHQMQVQTQLGPGWQIWMHVDTFYKNPDGAKKTLGEGDWDAVVIQHFGAHPLLKDNARKTVFHNQEPFPEPRDVSDLASAAAIIDVFLSRHPDRGRVFLYNSWPGIDGVGDFMVLKRVKERKPTLEEMLPLMRSFDYSAAWLAKYERNGEVPFASKHSHSRDYVWRLMDELKAKYPKLWQEKRLALIPNGDVFLALDKKLRAGQMPGIENVGFFSRDGGHVRAGLPRYTLAATCYAVIFGAHPGKLDGAIYNDLESYQNENLNKLPGKIGPGYIHWPDLGELLEITPERKTTVDDTIWDVVQGHPYTQTTNQSR
ncbi:MAG: hypothetical protein MUF25_29050 [Pirellulaceae bacterium]|nr:hypothetical protein [Pirellulaceae bacterium]